MQCEHILNSGKSCSITGPHPVCSFHWKGCIYVLKKGRRCKNKKGPYCNLHMIHQYVPPVHVINNNYLLPSECLLEIKEQYPSSILELDSNINRILEAKGITLDQYKEILLTSEITELINANLTYIYLQLSIQPDYNLIEADREFLNKVKEKIFLLDKVKEIQEDRMLVITYLIGGGDNSALLRYYRFLLSRGYLNKKEEKLLATISQKVEDLDL